MRVDVVVETVIARPTEVVATFAGDPTNAPVWYRNISSVEWESEPPLTLGSRLAFVAHFMRRELRYTYEIVELAPLERLVMRTVQGPFAMETTYTWAPCGPERTEMTLRNRGEPTGFSRLAAPLMKRAMRRAMTNDLEALRALLEF